MNSDLQMTHSGETRDRILEAAEKVFCELGFTASSLEDVAAAARIPLAEVRREFPSKRDLWGEVTNRRFAEYFERQSEILSNPDVPERSMTDSFQALFQFFHSNPEFIRLHRWSLVEGLDLDEPHAGTALTTHAVQAISMAQEAHFIRSDVDPAAVLCAVFALAEGWFLAKPEFKARFGTALPDDDVYLDAIIKLFVPSLIT